MLITFVWMDIITFVLMYLVFYSWWHSQRESLSLLASKCIYEYTCGGRMFVIFSLLLVAKCNSYPLSLTWDSSKVPSMLARRYATYPRIYITSYYGSHYCLFYSLYFKHCHKIPESFLSYFFLEHKLVLW